MGQSEIGTEVAGLDWGHGLGGVRGTLVTDAAGERQESEQIEARPSPLLCTRLAPGKSPSVRDDVAGHEDNSYCHHGLIVVAAHEGCSLALDVGRMTAAQTEAHDSPPRVLEGT